MSLDTTNTFFTVLTFIANVAFVVLVLVGMAALTGAGGRRLAGRVVSAIGRTVPTIAGQGFDGSAVRFVSHGKPRVVLFLAHWCPHCQAEVPRMVKLAKQGKLAGVEIDTVVTNTDKSFPNYPPSKWLKREHWPFAPVLADDSKSRALAAFGGDGFPFFVVIGANGKVVARASGEIAPSDIARVFKDLVAGKSVFH